MKICKKCNITKSLDRFGYGGKWMKNECKDCINNKLKLDRRIKDPDKYIIKTTKVCKHCLCNKNLDHFRLKTGSIKSRLINPYRSFICNDCLRIYNNVKNKIRRSCQSKDQKHELYLKYSKPNISKYSKTKIDLLKNSYVAGMLTRHTDLKPKDIPKYLIELQKTKLLIKRKLKSK